MNVIKSQCALIYGGKKLRTILFNKLFNDIIDFKIAYLINAKNFMDKI